MKRTLILLGLVLLITALLAPAAGATLFNLGDLGDLEHQRYYRWGANWDPGTENIVGATLTFKQIYNWQAEDYRLYVTLLDNPALGTSSFWDNQNFTDAFAGQGHHLVTYKPYAPYANPLPVGYANRQDVSFTFDANDLVALNSYLVGSDNRFGLGIDPDCHFYNDGITLTVETAPAVPEPATLLLVGGGLLGLAGLKRKFKK